MMSKTCRSGEQNDKSCSFLFILTSYSPVNRQKRAHTADAIKINVERSTNNVHFSPTILNKATVMMERDEKNVSLQSEL